MAATTGLALAGLAGGPARGAETTFAVGATVATAFDPVQCGRAEVVGP